METDNASLHAPAALFQCELPRLWLRGLEEGAPRDRRNPDLCVLLVEFVDEFRVGEIGVAQELLEHPVDGRQLPSVALGAA